MGAPEGAGGLAREDEAQNLVLIYRMQPVSSICSCVGGLFSGKISKGLDLCLICTRGRWSRNTSYD